MLSLFRKWSIKLRRRRLRKEREMIRSYKILTEDAKGHAQRCHNCRAPLTGPYCHVCGQRDDDLRRPIWTFFRELMDALFDTDSKLLKTLFLLLLVPGGLSRAFNMGRRARFLPPLRLYIVLSFTFFIMLSISDILILDVKVTPKEQVTAAREAMEKKRELQEEMKALQDELKAEADKIKGTDQSPPSLTDSTEKPEVPDVPASVPPEVRESLDEIAEEIAELDSVSSELKNSMSETSPGEVGLLINQLVEESIADANGSEEIAKAQEKIQALLNDPNNKMSAVEQEALRKVLEIDVADMAASEEKAAAVTQVNDDDLPYSFEAAMFVPNDKVERVGIDQRDIDHILQNDNTPRIVKTVTVNFMETLKNPKEFNDLFNDSIPWAMVILVPVFALILKITHWGKRRYYLNQLVFALHYHSFLFVLLTAFAFIVPKMGGEVAARAFWFITSAYLIIALKVGQEQGWIRAFIKAGFIYVSYFVIMTLTLSMVLFLTLGDYSLADLVNGELPEFETDSSSEE